MPPKKFKLLSNSTVNPELKAGTIVYEAMRHDYGTASSDTRHYGYEHVSVSATEDGEYPLFTHPEHLLQQIED